MIETARLSLLPLTLDQLRLHVADDHQLEASLGLRKGHREVVEPLLSIITHFTVPRLKDPNRNSLYHTIWIAIDRQKELIVADAKFKGEPDETGTVEIGYGTYPAFQRQGYMSEMVGGLVQWVGQQPGVRRIVADTDVENVASQRVLDKNGFRLFDRIEQMLWWEYVFQPASIQTLFFDKNGYLQPYECIPTNAETVKHYFALNAHRAGLWQEFSVFLAVLRGANVPIMHIWLDGSFVTQTAYPNAIDVVIYVPHGFVNGRFGWLTALAQPYPELHVIWIALREENNSLSDVINELAKFDYYDLFSTDKSDRPKGFIELNG